MSDVNFKSVFIEELVRIAPDIEAESINEQDHLQDDLGLDSMDVLNLVAALHDRLDINIPEMDYEQISAVAKAARYLEHKANATD